MEKLSDLEREKWSTFWKHREGNLLGIILGHIRTKIVTKIVTKNYSSRGPMLEAGSGLAVPTIYLGKMQRGAVFALDIVFEVLKESKELAEKRSVYLNTVCGDLRHIPFKDKSFGLVFSDGVLEHFQDPIPIIKEMNRVSKVTIAVLHTGLIWNLAKQFKKVIKEDRGVASLHYEYYDIKSALHFFKSAGYSKIKARKFCSMFLIIIASSQ